MRRTYVYMLLLSVISAIDRGGSGRITIRETFRKMKDRTILEWFVAGVPPDLAQLIPDRDQNRIMLDILEGKASAATASKYAVENSGLCLLASLIGEVGMSKHQSEYIATED